MKRIAVLASGGGSNLGALLEYLDGCAPAPAAVRLVVSDKPTAGALERARTRGIAAATLADPADANALSALLAQYDTDIVVLAGYLKLVPMQVTVRYAGAMVNVHPALLPAHGGPGMYGKRVHRAVLAAGERESGATVHFVDHHYDRGAAVAWARVPVEPGDTEESLALRVLIGEHFLLPRAVHAIAIGAIRLASSGAVVVTQGAASLFENPPPPVAIRLVG